MSALLNKIAYGYRLKNGTTINPFLYMDDIKLHVYAKNEKDINSLIYFTRVFSPDIDITVGLAKCGRPIVDKGKVKSTSETSLPDSRRDDIDKCYKYFGNNDGEVRCKATSEYRNRAIQVLRSKLSSKNKVTVINTLAVPVMQYPDAVASRRRDDLKETNIGTIKLMTMHDVFQLKPSTARIYTSRKERGRCLRSIENVVH